jgi:hypothetical protein
MPLSPKVLNESVFANHLKSQKQKLVNKPTKPETKHVAQEQEEYDEDIFADQKISVEPLTCFRELVNSSIINLMKQFGP